MGGGHFLKNLQPSKYPKSSLYSNVRTWAEMSEYRLLFHFRVLCKILKKCSPILTMFFLYTIVSYMIYLQLQILCILPLNPTLIKQYLYLCSKIWKIYHLLEIENQLVMMIEAHYHQRWYNKIDTVELVSIITTHQVPN